MTKKDLIKIASQHAADPKSLINAIFRSINTAVLQGERVEIHNFGTFYRRLVKRTVWNFPKKEKAPFQNHIIKFRPSRRMQKFLNNKLQEIENAKANNVQ